MQKQAFHKGWKMNDPKSVEQNISPFRLKQMLNLYKNMTIASVMKDMKQRKPNKL